VSRKIEQFLAQNLSFQQQITEQIMGDKYEVGQAGAVGPNAHGHDMQFNQIWHKSSEQIDLSQLHNELSVLRNELKNQAATPEQDIVVGSIAEAELAAKEGNGPQVMKHLARAGKWAIEVAETIGTRVAAEVIAKSIQP